MVNKIKLTCGLVVLLILISGCVDEEPIQNGAQTTLETTPKETKAPSTVKFSLTSQGFQEGENIPIKYTCDGDDKTPPLSWEAPPDNTKSMALILDDPDAPGGVFTHWVLFNLSSDVRSLPEGVPKLDRLENGGIQGVNDFDEIGYNGPCPPPGKPHTYRFILYALDTELNLSPGATKDEVIKAMEGHIVEKTGLNGEYSKV